MNVTFSSFLALLQTISGSRSRSPEAGLLSPHRSAVRSYIVIVFFDSAGKAVVSCGVGHEVVVVALCGVHGRFQRAFSGIIDGARWKSRMSVCVVGRVKSHVVVVQCT